MAGISEAAFSQGDVMRRLAELERQVRELTAGRRLEAASIGAGGITIRGGALSIIDAEGDLVAQVGKLSDGTYGIAAINSAGQLMALSTLAFGMAAAHVGDTEDTTSTSFTDLATPGPAVTTTIGATGRCLVFMCATLNPTPLDGLAMSVAVSGATTRGAGDFFTNPYTLSNATTTAGSGIGACRPTLLTGLNPGLTTFTAKYASDFGAQVFFGNRTLIVMPF